MSGLKPKAKAVAAPLDEGAILSAYARWAPVYDNLFGVVTIAGRRAATDAVNRLPPGRVLEAGVGTGISLPAYDRRHRVTGIDLSPDMLERAERRVRRQGLSHVEGLREMDVGRLDMPDASFDIVMAMYLITVVPEPHRAMSELIRVTRPGGKLIFVNHFAAEGGSRAWVERRMAPFACKLGWEPTFPIDRVVGRPELKLVEERPVPPFGLFTLLVFDRLDETAVAA